MREGVAYLWIEWLGHSGVPAERGWDPSGGSVSGGRARTAAGEILATGVGAVAIRLEMLPRPLN